MLLFVRTFLLKRNGIFNLRFPHTCRLPFEDICTLKPLCPKNVMRRWCRIWCSRYSFKTLSGVLLVFNHCLYLWKHNMVEDWRRSKRKSNYMFAQFLFVYYSFLLTQCLQLFQVLVVANPANTNALILKEFAPSIPAKNVTCLTRLDHNRALGQISERLNVPVSEVKNVIIWGNHSSTQYPDVNHATVKTSAGEKPVRELVKDDEWYDDVFLKFKFTCRNWTPPWSISGFELVSLTVILNLGWMGSS